MVLPSKWGCSPHTVRLATRRRVTRRALAAIPSACAPMAAHRMADTPTTRIPHLGAAITTTGHTGARCNEHTKINCVNVAI